MQKLYFIMLFLLIGNAVQAQFTSGGEIEESAQEEEIVRTSENIFDELGVQLAASWISPRGNFGTPPPNSGGSWSRIHKGEQGFGATSGFGAHLRWFTYWIKPATVPQLRVGNRFGVGFGFIPINWTNAGWDKDEIYPMYLIELDLGPAVSFNAGDVVVLDAGIIITPTLGISPEFYGNDFDLIEESTFLMVQTGLHLGVRGGGVTLGLDVIGGTAEYDFTVGYYDEFFNYNSFTVFSELPVQTLRLSFGFAF